ncbi:hypothetical protein EI94DRAFT_1797652 [Lactarius quietus]|nr:hypothetical protein EI94DRAFT_1797652 [Lactarius quietus]
MMHLVAILKFFDNFASTLHKISSQPNADEQVRHGLAQQLIGSFNSPISELGNLPLVKWVGLAPLHTHTGPHPTSIPPNLSVELQLLKISFDGALPTLAQEVKDLLMKVDKPPWAPTKPASPTLQAQSPC